MLGILFICIIVIIFLSINHLNKLIPLLIASILCINISINDFYINIFFSVAVLIIFLIISSMTHKQ